MVDFDPDVLAKLKATGLYSDEQEQQLKKDRKRQDEQNERRRKENQRRQERNFGQQNRKGGKGGKGGGFAPQHVTAQCVHGVYGEVLSAPPATKPQAIATAPYNFIPLPDDVLPSPLDETLRTLLTDGNGTEKSQLSPEETRAVSQVFHAFRTQGKRYDGAITLSIENLTPLFIGGTGKDTFAPTGTPMIPGSELRGLTKNLLKMITCGTWRASEDMMDQHLYYRSLMAPRSAPFNSGLHALYADKMTGESASGRVVKNAKPGFLVKRGRRYFIYPLLDDERVHAIVIRDYMKSFHASDRDVRTSAVRWQGHTAYVQVGLLSTRGLKTKDEIEEFFRVTPPKQRNRIGKQYYKYFSIDDIDKAKGIEVPPEVLEEYRNDKNRRGMDLVRQNHVIGQAPTSIAGMAAFDAVIPCFYLAEDGVIKAFGHGQSFRIPYDHATMDAVPGYLKAPVVDFTDAMFGRTGKALSWASRVAFEDAVATHTKGTESESLAQALMQPNPTSFQLYLAQDKKDELVHWDTPGARIRGYKMYWHQKNGHDWRARTAERTTLAKREEGSANLLKTITPLKAGATFAGRIRFRDLDEVELGALLRVFHLAENNEEIAYKIGMGKSIGLGSIRIVAELSLEGADAYQTLFDGDGWQEPLQAADPAPFLAAYDAYVKQAGSAVEESYTRIRAALSAMLDYRSTQQIAQWEPATAAINGNTDDPSNHDTRFQNRNVLPTPQEVVQYAKKGL